MRQYQALIAQINRWQSDDTVAHACERLIRYLVDHNSDSIKSLTYSSLAEITNLEILSSSLESVLTTLSATYPALELEFRYFAQDGWVDEVGPEEKTEFVRTGRFADPRSGEEIKDAGSFLYPFYRPRYDYLLAKAKHD